MLTYIDFPVDYKYLLQKFEEATFKPIKYYGIPISNFLVSKIKNDLYVNSILNQLNINGSPRFVNVPANKGLPTHIDMKTQCSINFLLEDYQDPIIFGLLPPYKKFIYKSAIIDTSKFHSVKATNYDRKIFKISIFQESFDTICKQLNKFVIN